MRIDVVTHALQSFARQPVGGRRSDLRWIDEVPYHFHGKSCVQRINKDMVEKAILCFVRDRRYDLRDQRVVNRKTRLEMDRPASHEFGTDGVESLRALQGIYRPDRGEDGSDRDTGRGER